MFNVRTTLSSFMTVAALLTLAGFATVQAAPQTAFAIAGGTTPAANVFYTGGLNGALTIATSNAFLVSKVGLGFDPTVTISFTPLIGVGGGGYTFNPVNGIFDLILNGGGFTITDTKTKKLLLQGNFDLAILHGTNGSSSAGITLMQDSVKYVAPLPYFPKNLVPGGGSLSIEFIATQPIIATPNVVNPFNASDGMTFAAP